MPKHNYKTGKRNFISTEKPKFDHVLLHVPYEKIKECFQGDNGYDWIESISENMIRLKRDYVMGHELEKLQKLVKVLGIHGPTHEYDGAKLVKQSNSMTIHVNHWTDLNGAVSHD